MQMAIQLMSWRCLKWIPLLLVSNGSSDKLISCATDFEATRYGGMVQITHCTQWRARKCEFFTNTGVMVGPTAGLPGCHPGILAWWGCDDWCWRIHTNTLFSVVILLTPSVSAGLEENRRVGSSDSRIRRGTLVFAGFCDQAVKRLWAMRDWCWPQVPVGGEKLFQVYRYTFRGSGYIELL